MTEIHGQALLTLSFFEPPLQHCHMTEHQTLHKPSWLPFWHKQNDVAWQKWRYILYENHFQAIWPLNFCCATISSLSHDWTLNSPQTQWVVMVAQAVTTATMTAYYDRNLWSSTFNPFFFLSHRYNTVTWQSTELFTNPVGCHFGTSRFYGNNVVMICLKTMPKWFWPPIFAYVTISTPLPRWQSEKQWVKIA